MTSGDPLGLDPATMRRLGHQAVDMLVETLTDGSEPPLRRATPAQMRERLGGAAPDGPGQFSAILERLEKDVLPFRSRVDHPGFFAFVPSCGTWPGALGDLIASACNIYAGSWMESAGPSQVELEVLGWFKDWVGYPKQSAGTLVTGGSAANLTALACARETLAGGMDDRLVVYVSDQAHSSLARAARLLGFRRDQVRVLPTDPVTFRLEPSTVAAAIEADRQARRIPLFVSASAGSTNAGAVDPLAELSALCREQGVWLHADAAYGGFAALTDRGRRQLAGMELADSITLDPHKWLYQSYECGCLLVRDGRSLRSAFEIVPDYLRDARADGGEINFCDLGVQLTRSSRALKVWISLHLFGLDAFKAAINRSLDLAAAACRRVEQSRHLELMAPPSLGIVCLRRRFDGVDDPVEVDRLNARLVDQLECEGFAVVSSTRLGGRYAIRLCVLNHTTGPDDVERTLSFLENAEPAGHAVPPAVPAAPVETPLEPLFGGLGRGQLEHVLELAGERHAVEGETIVAEWEQSRDFYVILEGAAEVVIGGEHRLTLGAGDFFGELGALDWGAGYGLSRTATVRTGVATRLLVLADGVLNRVIGELPLVESRIRATAARRLGERRRGVP